MFIKPHRLRLIRQWTYIGLCWLENPTSHNQREKWGIDKKVSPSNRQHGAIRASHNFVRG